MTKTSFAVVILTLGSLGCTSLIGIAPSDPFVVKVAKDLLIQTPIFLVSLGQSYDDLRRADEKVAIDEAATRLSSGEISHAEYLALVQAARHRRYARSPPTVYPQYQAVVTSSSAPMTGPGWTNTHTGRPVSGTVVGPDGSVSTYSGTTASGTIMNTRDGSLSTYSGNSSGGTIMNLETGGLSTYQLNPGGGGTILNHETGEITPLQ